MKHLLNNMSEDEKNRIREQHEGGMKVEISRFKSLLESTMGDVRPLISEQTSSNNKIGANLGKMAGAAVPDNQTSSNNKIGANLGKMAGAAVPSNMVGVVKKILDGGGNAHQKVKSVIHRCLESKYPTTAQTNKIADSIYSSVSGLGTDENMVYSVMKGLRTLDEFCGVIKSYRSTYGESLYTALDGDFDSESEWVEIMKPLRDVVLKSAQSRPVTGVKTVPPRPVTGVKTVPPRPVK